MLRLGTIAGDVERETVFVTGLTRDPQIDLVIRCVDRVEVLAAIRSRAVDALVAIGVPEWFDYQLLEEAHERGVRLIAVAADPIEAEKLEVAGFRVLSEEERRDLAKQVRNMEELPLGELEPRGEGRLIAVWGPKGSPGRTTVAIEVATTLARSTSPVVLVDGDLYGGDVMQMLALAEDLPGIVPLLRELERGDGRDPAWSGRLPRAWRAGPAVIPGLMRPELWREISSFGWRELVKIIRRDFGFGVVDVGFCLENGKGASDELPSRNEVALHTMAEAERTIAVLRADPVGIKAFAWAVRDYPELLDHERVLIVANKVRRGEEPEVRRLIRRYLGRSVFACLPDVPVQALLAMWEGTPLSLSEPAGVVAEEVRRIADAVGGRVEADGLLTRIARGGRR